MPSKVFKVHFNAHSSALTRLPAAEKETLSIKKWTNGFCSM